MLIRILSSDFSLIFDHLEMSYRDSFGYQLKRKLARMSYMRVREYYLTKHSIKAKNLCELLLKNVIFQA